MSYRTYDFITGRHTDTLPEAAFKIDIPENILRKMTRKQYYQAMSYLRLVRKKLILYRER
jgi:hypothetical protein